MSLALMRAENPCRGQAPRGLEPLIAPEPLTQHVVADKAEAYGGNSRSEKTASNSLQHQGHRNGDKLRPKGDDESAEADHDGT